jgi:hypothetical protein
LALRSTVWIVPFLMFFDVTTMVAAVAVVQAITAETTAAMSALFTVPLLVSDPFMGSSKCAGLGACQPAQGTSRKAEARRRNEPGRANAAQGRKVDCAGSLAAYQEKTGVSASSSQRSRPEFNRLLMPLHVR